MCRLKQRINHRRWTGEGYANFYPFLQHAHSRRDTIYESTSLIITTNKSPAEWARSLDDEVLATALLDRILYKCELLQLSGNSYRMTNRKTIFKDEQKKEIGQKTKI